MAMAPIDKLVLGSIAFVIFWVLAVFPAVPFLPIGRTAGSILGGMLMVIFQVISPTEAYNSIDLSIIGLLFGTMIVSIYLERADAFKYLGKLLAWKSLGAKDLMCRVCVISAIASAFFNNDTCCMVLTEFVLEIARQQNLPPQPFLLALASSANIGSSATPIGNPQNLVIALTAKVSFSTFLVGIFPAALVGVLVNTGLLLCMYWKQLSPHKDDEEDASEEIATSDYISFRRFLPATMSHMTSLNNFLEREPMFSSRNGNSVCFNSFRHPLGASESGTLRVPSVVLESPGSSNVQAKWKIILWKSCVYLVTIGMLIALVMGKNMSWTAVTAAIVLMVVDFKDAQPCLEKVSYSLLIFFCGMFMTIDGFDSTGIPSSLWDYVEPHARIDSARGIAVLALVIVVLSNLISNVPTVSLLGARMAAAAGCISPEYVTRAWLILAWASTVAGNLSLLGSAANIIVCEQARRAPLLISYDLSFWSHLKFGVPSTIIVTTLGLTLI